MKVSAINNTLKNTIGTALLAGTIIVTSPKAQAQEIDKFEQVYEVSPKGTSDIVQLLWAPDPRIMINGEIHLATMVIDLSKNVLYKYDEKGKATNAYLVASGAKETPSTPGIKVVTHVESYPYKLAPPNTKRYKNPKAYGPRIICLETVDPKTGNRGITGEFIHGNNDPKSLGKYVSQGCIRMDNEVIKQLAKEVERGDFILVIE